MSGIRSTLLESARTTARLTSIDRAANSLTALGIVASIALLAWEPVAVLFVAAAMFGASEINGLCGVSHIGSLTPLLSQGRRVWVRAALAYTLGGVATSFVVGATVGVVGSMLQVSTAALPWIIPLAVILAAREFGFVRFPLPQVRKQTQKMWALQYGYTVGAAMWGAHIGLAFFTVVRHGGFYVVAAVALMLEPSYAGCIFTVYWIGRTLLIWLAPLLVKGDARRNGGEILQTVFESERPFAVLAAAGLLSAAAAIAILATA